MLRALRHRSFRLLWLGQALSQLGDRVVVVALALYVDELGTPTDVGLVLAAQTLPLVGFVLLGGVWADRLPRHRVMIAADLARAALHGLLALLILADAAAVWHIVAIEALFGLAGAFFYPAYTGLVPQTVPEELVQEANAARGLMANLAEFLGPAIGAALVLGLGAGTAFALDALSFLVAAALLAGVRPRARGAVPPREPVLAELAAGWRAVRERAWVWAIIGATSVALLVAIAPLYTLGPSVSGEVYGDRGVFAQVLSAFGLGTLLGALLGVRWRPRRPIWAANLATLPWALGMVAFPLGLPVALLLGGWVVAGAGIGLFAVWWETALAERIPPHLLSRVTAFDWMGSLGLLPLGYLLAGPLAAALGGREVLVAGGTLAALIILAVLLVPDVRRLERRQNAGVPASGVEASA